MTSRTVELPEIGEVFFERSSRARHINITVKPFRGVRVAVPIGVSYEEAEEAAREKSRWIKEKLEKAKLVEQQHEEERRNPGFIILPAARSAIVERLDELAEKYGFSYNKVYIKNQKTRWGSCSAKRNISLNFRISLLPRELMDYVLLHELMHTRYLNHSSRFWEELDRILGDAKALDRQLKEYRFLLAKIFRTG